MSTSTPTLGEITVIDMHTGGEPVRIPLSGLPDVPGDTILAKRRHAREHLDHIRRFLMFEPRGHRDMYGAWLVKPTLPGADLAVLFLHNEGYSTMCGHAVIALARFAVDRGLVKRAGDLTRDAELLELAFTEARARVEEERLPPAQLEYVRAVWQRQFGLITVG